MFYYCIIVGSLVLNTCIWDTLEVCLFHLPHRVAPCLLLVELLLLPHFWHVSHLLASVVLTTCLVVVSLLPTVPSSVPLLVAVFSALPGVAHFGLPLLLPAVPSSLPPLVAVFSAPPELVNVVFGLLLADRLQAIFQSGSGRASERCSKAVRNSTDLHIGKNRPQSLATAQLD